MRFVAALLAYVSLRFFFFWVAAAFIFPQQPYRAGLLADVLALGCAGSILYLWPKKRRASDASAPIQRPASGLAFGSRIHLCALVAGSIGFAVGFFGPIVLKPDANLGPIMGIILTGPAGFLLGPAIGVASLMRQISLADLRKATLWLTVQGVLACSLYALFAEVYVWAAFGVGLMLVTIAVGTALFVHTVRRLNPPKPVVACAAILLAGAVLMLCLSVFPPVVAPSWGAGPDAGAPVPAFAFLLDPGLDTSRHVPQYTVNRPLWALEMLLVAGSMGVGLLIVKIIARSRPSQDDSLPAA